MNKKILLIVLSIFLVFTLTACESLEQLENGSTAPAASSSDDFVSGTFSAHEVNLASLIGGEVESVYYDLGDIVNEGDLVLTLNTDLVDAQIRQGETAITSAETQVDAALLSYQAAQLEYANLEKQIRMGETETRAAEWQSESVNAFDLPAWYFNRGDTLTAAQSELADALDNLEIEQKNLASELEKASNADIVAAEERLAAAREAYNTADLVLDAANDAKDNKALKDAAQEQLDSAEAELEAAQLHYEQILSSSAADAVLEARARLAAAQKRADLAQDRVDSLTTGEDNLLLQSAELQIDQAELLISQAEAQLEQAKAGLASLETQLAKHNLFAPLDGVVLTRAIEPGEILNPSATALVIGKLDTLTLKIYLPEDQYGKVQLGQEVSIRVDSFPGESFKGTVVYIANKAEYTPRNVQTVEGRHSTVYAIEIHVKNTGLKLKPGMPADVLLSSFN